jgi:hypothetical protein
MFTYLVRAKHEEKLHPSPINSLKHEFTANVTKRSQLNLECYHGICFKGLRKTL